MTENTQPQFAIQRIYLKDASFESPNAPAVFKHPWEPQVNMDMNTRAALLDEGIYDVTLMLTVTTKIKDDVAFIAEVHQSGIFTVSGFPETSIQQMLAAYIPNILFPYARTVLDQLIVSGSYPALMLAPINFDGLYQQRLSDAAAALASEAADTEEAPAKH